MREIKFRGKTLSDDHKWLYGNLNVNDDGKAAIMRIGDFWSLQRVDPESVGQFTGLRDDDGREIYEGDIVRVVHYGEESSHTVKYFDDEDYPAFDLDPHFDCDSNGLSFCQCERETTITVIGNVYDSPELLEGKDA